MTNWLPSNTVRLAKLAHPGTEWGMIGTYMAVKISADGDPMPRGGPKRCFDSNRLDALARAESAILARDILYADDLYDHLERAARHDAGTWISRSVVASATPDQRRRALIAVLDAHPEIEEKR